jgi:hypothetical protein
MRTIRRIAQNVAAKPRDKVGPEWRDPEKLRRKGKITITDALQRRHYQLDRKFSIFSRNRLAMPQPRSIGIADVQHAARIPLHPHRLMHCAAQDLKSRIAATVIQTGDASHIVARLGEMRNASTA